jgi:hypothetical protein
MSGYFFAQNIMNQELIAQFVGKIIAGVQILSDSILDVSFADGTKLSFTDNGQSCCEKRYMSMDGDDPSEYIGATFNGATLRDTEYLDDTYDVHEVAWLAIHTTKGDLTVSNHNEHNGYYGGFSIEVAAY